MLGHIQHLSAAAVYSKKTCKKEINY